MELRKKCYTAQQIHEAIDGVVNDDQKHMEIYKRLAQMEQECEVVIRCKDCKHRDAENGLCEGRGWPMQLVPDDGFCDKGKRRKNG